MWEKIEISKIYKGNAIKHFINKHESIFIQNFKKYKEKPQIGLSKYKFEQNTNINADKTSSFKCNKPSFVYNLVDIFVSGGCAFTILENDWFKNILKPFSSELNLKINKNNITTIINHIAEIKRNEITKVFENKIISIKFDGCTKHRRRFLWINGQFYDEGIKCVNLGII